MKTSKKAKLKPKLKPTGSKRKIKVRMPPVPRSSELPVNQRMLFLVRDELLSGQRAIEHRLTGHDKHFQSMEKRFDGLERRFEALEKRFEGLEKRFEGLEKRMDAFEHRIDAKLDKMSAQIHQIALLVEEQNHRNTIVLDGLRSLFERQERIETRVTDLEK